MNTLQKWCLFTMLGMVGALTLALSGVALEPHWYAWVIKGIAILLMIVSAVGVWHTIDAIDRSRRA